MKARILVDGLKNENPERIEVLWLYGVPEELLPSRLFLGETFRGDCDGIKVGDAG